MSGLGRPTVVTHTREYPLSLHHVQIIEQSFPVNRWDDRVFFRNANRDSLPEFIQTLRVEVLIASQQPGRQVPVCRLGQVRQVVPWRNRGYPGDLRFALRRGSGSNGRAKRFSHDK